MVFIIIMCYNNITSSAVVYLRAQYITVSVLDTSSVQTIGMNQLNDISDTNNVQTLQNLSQQKRKYDTFGQGGSENINSNTK